MSYAPRARDHAKTRHEQTQQVEAVCAAGIRTSALAIVGLLAAIAAATPAPPLTRSGTATPPPDPSSSTAAVPTGGPAATLTPTPNPAPTSGPATSGPATASGTVTATATRSAARTGTTPQASRSGRAAVPAPGPTASSGQDFVVRGDVDADWTSHLPAPETGLKIFAAGLLALALAIGGLAALAFRRREY